MTREAHLHRLLTEIFDGNEAMRIYVGHYYPELLPSVAWGGAPDAVAFQLMRVLDSRGYVDRDFFQTLLDDPRFARRSGLIVEVAAAWEIQITVEWKEKGTKPAPNPAPDAPATATQPPAAPTAVPPDATLPERGATPTPITFTVVHSGELRFVVLGPDGTRLLEPVELPDPNALAATENLRLIRALRWAMEELVEDPQPAFQSDYHKVMSALRWWGDQVRRRLITDEAWGLYAGALRKGRRPRILLQSTDPKVLAWPWEAVEGLRGQPWGVEADIIRSTRQTVSAPRFAAGSGGAVQVLLVTARPGGAQDVGFLTVARGVAEAVSGTRAQVTVLRPPTLAALRSELERRRGHYHVVHFDGHGVLLGSEAAVLFEDGLGAADQVGAAALARALMDHDVPVVVLNACRSAKIPEGAVTPFGAVATALVAAGVRAVVAMSYILSVGGARIFAPAFYETLFKTGEVEAATLEARCAMQRTASRADDGGPTRLDDWLLPVLYAREEVRFQFDTKAPAPPRPTLPPEVDPLPGGVPFLGRDDAFLGLERALTRQSSALLYGGPHFGKSALARAFARWRASTGGAGEGVLWLDGGSGLRGRLAGALGVDPSVESLTTALRERPRLLVVDGLSAASLHEDADPRWLSTVLRGLLGHQTRTLLTAVDGITLSRLLRDARPAIVALKPLDDRERYQLLLRATARFSPAVNLYNPELRQLAEATGGNPWLILELAHLLAFFSPGRLSKVLGENAEAVRSGDVAALETVLAEL